MTTVTDFWDRCTDIGDANGTHLWKCPKHHPDGAREIETLIPGVEVVESHDCYWIFSTFTATIDRISDTIVSEGMNPTVANDGENDE